MGNGTSECLNSLCDLSFLHVSNDLRKTSLQIRKESFQLQVKDKTDQSPIFPNRPRIESSMQDLDFESPKLRRDSEKAEARTTDDDSINESNFAILKV